MDRVFKPRKGFFWFVISIRFDFIHCGTDWMKINSFNFLNYPERDVCKQASVGIR